ncbi:MAG: SDR family NAD(P)-dependent oxidoreductase [Oscillospiraceae bacterium]|nr:SDR family NAD(P)-dependent oxidoreductase [Oscillospiraceae bacterium]
MIYENWLTRATVIITGASGGMGKGIAMKLIERYDCNVIGIARNEEKMKKVVEELGPNADKFTYQLFDVSVEKNWKNFAEYLKENDIQPDVLINNAGILPKFNRFGNYTVDYIKRVMDINFYSAVYSMHYIMPLLLNSSKAAVINVASSAALCSLAGTSVYTASKAALKGLTEAAREEYRGECYIGLVCPGFTKTDIFSSQGDASDSFANKAIDMVSMSCESMVRKIVHGISHKRDIMVYGIDAKLMEDGNRLAKVNTSKFSSKVMKISNLPLFESIFKQES